MERNRHRNPVVDTDEIDGKAYPLKAYILHGLKDSSDFAESQLLTPGPTSAHLSRRRFIMSPLCGPERDGRCASTSIPTLPGKPVRRGVPREGRHQVARVDKSDLMTHLGYGRIRRLTVPQWVRSLRDTEGGLRDATCRLGRLPARRDAYAGVAGDNRELWRHPQHPLERGKHHRPSPLHIAKALQPNGAPARCLHHFHD
jgi:hypothetical protein